MGKISCFIALSSYPLHRMGDYLRCFGLLQKHWGKSMGLLSYAVTLWHQFCFNVFYSVEIEFEVNSGELSFCAVNTSKINWYRRVTHIYY